MNFRTLAFLFIIVGTLVGIIFAFMGIQFPTLEPLFIKKEVPITFECQRFEFEERAIREDYYFHNLIVEEIWGEQWGLRTPEDIEYFILLARKLGWSCFSQEYFT